jgi:hypothetical protein
VTPVDAARWQVVNELFHAVIARAPDDRRAWLERECHGDRTLVEDVDRLIQAHERASDFLAGPQLSDATALVSGWTSGRGWPKSGSPKLRQRPIWQR